MPLNLDVCSFEPNLCIPMDVDCSEEDVRLQYGGEMEITAIREELNNMTINERNIRNIEEEFEIDMDMDALEMEVRRVEENYERNKLSWNPWGVILDELELDHELYASIMQEFENREAGEAYEYNTDREEDGYYTD